MSYGARVEKHGSDISEAKTYALELARKEGLLYVNGYVISGVLQLGGRQSMDAHASCLVYDTHPVRDILKATSRQHMLS